MRWLRPIPEEWIPLHLTLFIVFAMIGMWLRVVHQLPLHLPGDVVGFSNSLMDATVSVIVIAAALSTIIVETGMIFAERYLNYRFRKGLEEGEVKGVERGRQEGLETGEREALARVRSEMQRRGIELTKEDEEALFTPNGHPR